MVVTVAFMIVTAVLLAVLGRFVAAPWPAPDVEPPFARAVARGLLVVWLAGLAHADRIAREVDALSGREPPESHPSPR